MQWRTKSRRRDGLCTRTEDKHDYSRSYKGHRNEAEEAPGGVPESAYIADHEQGSQGRDDLERCTEETGAAMIARAKANNEQSGPAAEEGE